MLRTRLCTIFENRDQTLQAVYIYRTWAHIYYNNMYISGTLIYLFLHHKNIIRAACILPFGLSRDMLYSIL